MKCGRRRFVAAKSISLSAAPNPLLPPLPLTTRDSLSFLLFFPLSARNRKRCEMWLETQIRDICIGKIMIKKEQSDNFLFPLNLYVEKAKERIFLIAPVNTLCVLSFFTMRKMSCWKWNQKILIIPIWIPIISRRILIDLTRNFWFQHRI